MGENEEDARRALPIRGVLYVREGAVEAVCAITAITAVGRVRLHEGPGRLFAIERGPQGTHLVLYQTAEDRGDQ